MNTSINTRISLALSTGLLLLLCSCASTSVKQTWKSPDYSDGPVEGSVAVLVVEERGMLRIGLENRFARELRGEGQAALPTHEYFSLRQIEEDKNSAAAKLQEEGAKTVLILRLVTEEKRARSFRAGREDFQPVTTGFDPGLAYGPYEWYGYYSVAFQDMGTVWSTQSKHIYLESSLFDLANGKRIWSCLTETVLTENADSLEEMDLLAAKVVNALHKDGVVQ